MMRQLLALLSLVAPGLGQDLAVAPDYQPISEGSPVYTEAWSVDNCTTSRKGLPIFVLDATTGECQKTIMGPTRVPNLHLLENQIVYSPDGKHMAYANPNAIHIFDTTSWRCVKILKGTYHHGKPEHFFAIVYSPDSKQLAAGIGWTNKSKVGNGIVRIWDTATWDSKNLTHHMFSVQAVAFSPDGKQLTSSDGGWTVWERPGSIKIWDTATGKFLKTLLAPGDAEQSVVYSPDGQHLASNIGGAIEIWDTKTWKILKSIPCPDDPCWTMLKFSPDGKHLASASQWDYDITIWDTKTWHSVHAAQDRTVKVITYSPDGKRLAYIDDDHEPFGDTFDDDHFYPYIHVLDTATWSTVLTWKGPPDTDLGSVAFSPDGKHLVSYVQDRMDSHVQMTFPSHFLV